MTNITPERLANPQKLLKLAKVMGLRRPFITELGDYDQCLYCTEDDYIIFRPHLDKAQAMEVLEWLLKIGNKQLNMDCDYYEKQDQFGVQEELPNYEGGLFSIANTLPEAIVLCALELLDEND